MLWKRNDKVRKDAKVWENNSEATATPSITTKHIRMVEMKGPKKKTCSDSGSNFKSRSCRIHFSCMSFRKFWHFLFLVVYFPTNTKLLEIVSIAWKRVKCYECDNATVQMANGLCALFKNLLIKICDLTQCFCSTIYQFFVENFGFCCLPKIWGNQIRIKIFALLLTFSFFCSFFLYILLFFFFLSFFCNKHPLIY